MKWGVIIALVLLAVVSYTNADYPPPRKTTWDCVSKTGQTKMDCYPATGPGGGNEADQSRRGRKDDINGRRSDPRPRG